MIVPRIIPCLLLRGSGFVKTRRFKNPVYLGDCFNTVRLFNEKEADELLILDIDATPERRRPRFEFLQNLASECFMPLAYGGGVTTVADMRRLYALGIEKVCLNTAAIAQPELVREAAREFGSQSVIVAIDVRGGLWGGKRAVTHCGRQSTAFDPVAAAKRAEELGAGEILVNSIDRDGEMTGYDLDLLRSVTEAVTVPVIACGGAGSAADLRAALSEGGAAAAAAGSMFVFNGPHRAVLISYPRPETILAGLSAS
jgi:cyclase